MWNRKYLWIAGALLLWLIIFRFVIPAWEGLGRLYGRWVFQPVQAGRGALLNNFAFPFGDLLYILALMAILGWGFRGLWRLGRRQGLRRRMLGSLVYGAWLFIIVGFIFFIGWGGNYYKPELRKFWNLSTDESVDTAANAESGFAFYAFLGDQLNRYHRPGNPRPIREAEEEARMLYAHYTDLSWPGLALGVKTSLFGSLLPYLGIQGYYNPFTGEAQINGQMPPSLIPFVISHEMAHQAGIAAEGDANFLAYLICRQSERPEFQYSAALHLWLYTYPPLRRLDSARAEQGFLELDALVQADIKSIREYQRRHRGPGQRWSTWFYDFFLKWNRQSEGVKSYKLAGADVWAWENLPPEAKTFPISLP